MKRFLKLALYMAGLLVSIAAVEWAGIPYYWAMIVLLAFGHARHDAVFQDVSMDLEHVEEFLASRYPDEFRADIKFRRSWFN
jgi:hypothetical protein